MVWRHKLSPFKVLRLVGKGPTLDILAEYFSDKISDDYEKFIVQAYTYQLFMTEIFADIVLLKNFDHLLRPLLPLGSSSVLGNPNFEVPISIIFGEYDWMKDVDNG